MSDDIPCMWCGGNHDSADCYLNPLNPIGYRSEEIAAENRAKRIYKEQKQLEEQKAEELRRSHMTNEEIIEERIRENKLTLYALIVILGVWFGLLLVIMFT